MQKTKIEWADATWNPVTGCTKISPGCQHCYAERMATRLRGRFGYSADDPFEVTAHRERLSEPLHWKKPRRIFVCSMGDLFHPNVPTNFIREVYDVMWLVKRHTYMVLTKRPERLSRIDLVPFVQGNIWHLVTVEAQYWAGRINQLLREREQAPWPVLGVSVEPMLGPVDLSPWLPGLQWVICGAETGPGRRPMDMRWATALRDQCVEWNVPFFFKRNSSGEHDLNGQVWEQLPVRA